MGPVVLDAISSDPSVRVYAHCASGVPGGISVLALNLDATNPVSLALDLGADAEASAEIYLVTAGDAATGPQAKTISVAGEPPVVGSDGTPVQPAPKLQSAGEIVLPPLSYAFIVLPGSGAGACL